MRTSTDEDGGFDGSDNMDIRSYLKRIEYNGAHAATASTLRDLHLAHLRTVPFENLDIHLGNPIVLNLDDLYQKMVRRRRGGFCYEQNGLFAWLLRELGFAVTLLSARVATEDSGFGPEFDHLALLVYCAADPSNSSIPFLADVGFGDSFALPLRLDRLNEPQQDGLRAYRIDQVGEQYIMWQQGYDGTWERQYRFTLQPRRLAEFVAMCRYHQSSPQSHFTQRRVCSVAAENGRITLTESGLIITEAGERRERPLGEDEYHDILADQFGVILA